MAKRTILALCALAVQLAASAPHGTHPALIMPLPGGHLSLSNYMLYADGRALPSGDDSHPTTRVQTQRAAEENAAANLLHAASGIIVSADTTFADIAASGSGPNRRMLDSLSRYRLVQVSYFSNGVAARLGVPLLGDGNVMAIARESLLHDSTARFGVQPAFVEKASGTNYTSLIIDSRDVNAAMALFPAIYDTAGTLIYGLPFADPSTTVRNGLVTYLSALGIGREYTATMEKLKELHRFTALLRPVLMEKDTRRKERALEVFTNTAKAAWNSDLGKKIEKTMSLRSSANNKALRIDDEITAEHRAIEKQLKSTRFGYAPFFLAAWRVRGTHRCDIVIAPDDGRIILGNRSLHTAMKECRVAIIVH